MAKPANQPGIRRSERGRRPVRPTARTARGRAKKISITVDQRVLREVRQLIRGTGHSLSAHVTEALARDLRRRHLQQLIEEYESEHGAISEAELARVRAQWQG